MSVFSSFPFGPSPPISPPMKMTSATDEMGLIKMGVNVDIKRSDGKRERNVKGLRGMGKLGRDLLLLVAGLKKGGF